MIRVILSIFIFLVSVSYAERSMFGAGNLESSQPYGLTHTEEVIVKNKKIVAKNEKKLKKTTSELQDLNQRVDGIDSLLEGESIKLNKVYKSLNEQKKNLMLLRQTSESNIDKNTQSILGLQKKIDIDLEVLKSQIEQNKKNIKTLKKSFDKIVVLVNKINNDYVTKKDFNKLIALLDKDQLQSKKTTKVSKTKTSSKSSKELLVEAKAFFKKDYFTNAKPIFQELVSKNYRPAESNFYLGEIEYYRKNYKNALHYFKTSMTLYDKASYLPKLLLHSAISFEKLGDNENAQNFYSTIIDIYPESNEAKQASKKIK